MSGKYLRLGLRRDNNLSDVTNSTIALNNILNDLAQEGDIFGAEDLFISIKGLINTDVRNIDLTDLANQQVIYYDASRIPSFVNPLVTIKDQIDNYKLVTGDPPFLSGGDGPNAYFIPSDSINVVTANSVGTELYDNTKPIFGPYKFWTDGEFTLTNYVFENFPDADGMVKWEGFFAPEINVINNLITVESTGLLFVEVEINGAYETLLNIFAADRALTYTAASADTLTSLDMGDQYKHIGVGDLVKEVNGVDVSSSDIRVTSVNINNQTIGLSSGVTLEVGENTILFSFNVGDESIVSRFQFESLFLESKIPIRIYNWWPIPITGTNVSRNTIFRYSTTGSDSLQYTYFFSQAQSESQNDLLPESIEFFFNNYLQPKKRRTSEEVFVDDQISINYQPPTLVTNKRISSGTITSQTGVDISSSNLFTNAQVGDYIYVPNSPGEKIFQINRKITNSRVYLEGNPDTIDVIVSQTAYVIDHLGLIGIYDGVTAGSVVTLSEMSSIFPVQDGNGYSIVRDDMLLSNLVSSTYFVRATNMTEGAGSVQVDTLTVTTPQTIADGAIFVYSDKGLIDRSKVAFCAGVTAKEVATQAAAGATEIVLTDVTGITTGTFIQFDGTIPDETTIDGIVGNTVTISQPLAVVLGAGETVTLSPDSVNREVCNIALNTAPPFEGTERGLKTVLGNEGIECNILTVERLEMNIDVNNIVVNPSTDYTETMSVTSGGQTFNILIA